MEFEINGQHYRCTKMDTFKQFHVSRRLMPVLGGLASAASAESEAANEQGDIATFMQPIAEAVSQMSDADCDFILQSCLAVVQIQQGNGWANVTAVGGKTILFDHIDLGTMLKIATNVIQDNLGGFFHEGAAALSTSDPTAAA
jgi:hypothetical protein